MHSKSARSRYDSNTIHKYVRLKDFKCPDSDEERSKAYIFFIFSFLALKTFSLGKKRGMGFAYIMLLDI